MKKFLFRLETALALRLSRESIHKRELEQTCQKLNHAKEKEKMLTAQIASLIEEIQQRRASGILDLQETYAQILDHLQSSLAQVQQGLLLQEKQIEMLKIRFKEAIQERKVIEKIKEKHYAGWRLREARSEGAFLDEIALKKSADAE